MQTSPEPYVSTEISPAARIVKALARIRFARVLFVLLLTGVAVYDLKLLTRYSVPAGVDGYYYVLQTTAVLQRGTPYFDTGTPVVAYILAGFTFLTRNSVLTVKLTAVLLQLLLCLGVFTLLREVIQSKWLALLGATIAAISGLRFFMISEFINNLAAVVFLLWTVWFLIRFVRTERSLFAIGGAVLFVAGLFTHRMAAVIVVGIAALAGLLYLFITQKSLWKWSAVALLVCLWFLPLILAAQQRFEPPFGLRGELSVAPRWPFDRFAFPEELMLVFGGALLVVLLFRFRDRFDNRLIFYFFGAVALWSLLVTLNPFLNPERGWLSVAVRLRGLTYVQAALVIPGLIWCALQVRREFALYLLAAVAPLLLMSALAPLPHGMRSEVLAERQQLNDVLPEARTRLKQGAFVIAAHGDQFMITAVTGVVAQQTRPQTDQPEAIYWLIKKWANTELLPADVVVRPDSTLTSTVFIEDAEMMTRLMRLDVYGRRQVLSANPHLASAYGELRRGPAASLALAHYPK